MVADPGASSISVTVRVRPFTIREAAQLTKTDDGTVFLGDGSMAAAPAPKLHQRGIRSVIKVVDDRCLVFDPPENNPVQKFSRSVVGGRKVKDQVFAFDRIFDDNAQQTEVYEGTTKTLLDSVLDGYNATVFAYGATGCGKTHTITGTPQQPGIIFLTMQELFEKIAERSDDKVTEVTLSYLEIYNETIRDLLVPGGSKQGLMLREDTNQAVTVAGLTSHRPANVQEVMDMIVQGNEYRTVSPTEANATSSRSHAVLQINVAQRDRNAGPSEPHTMATLSIIDLAGSERASATKNRGDRLMEGANINKSLLALGSCINALCDPRRNNHIPYRNSKLTRLLKFSLGGNCKTVMIVCVSPSSAHFDETQNTLRYANRAKNIQTKVTRNVFNVNRHVKDFLVKIDEQMAMINELKAQQKDAEKIFFAKFRKQTEKTESTCREGVQRLRAAYDNTLEQRREKITLLKRQKLFERRISILSAWLASFDAVCAGRGGDEGDMPGSLRTMRKTAQGILVELEASRHHLHQRLEATNWERAVDTALQHAIRLLEADDPECTTEVATLQRESELLKSNFAKEMYREVLEQERAGDAATMQILLTAQFEMVSSLSDTLAMSEADAVTHAKGIVNRLLESGVSAASHVVKPDGVPPAIEAFPPTRRGTPKKRQAAPSPAVPRELPRDIPQQPVFAASAIPPHVPASMTSPTKSSSSPRRRKAPLLVRKAVMNHTPKKKSPSKRSVRWRDDDGDGTLVDFQKTPQKYDSSPELAPPPEARSMRLMSPSPLSYNEPDPDSSSLSTSSPPPSSSLDQPAESTNIARPGGRFQAGFLSKSRPRNSNSPILRAPSLSLNLGSGSSPTSSDASDKPSPLRTLSLARSTNMSPPAIERPPNPSPPRLADENEPPSRHRSPSSDSESSSLDARRIGAAMAKRHARRVSLASLPAPSASRPPRASLAGSLSSSNGVSRRRNSGESRISPPVSCSPPEMRAKAFTLGQARRMNLGGSVREGSPPTREEGSRRVTISGMAHRQPRASLGGWR
ncbi:probable kinesin-related protein KIP3 [Cephalotrichum gorgonifer]|uniref:Probable kinesin-related protein KIP3 n=1 Tax=Cephalotrichum gorgonifer TaxID=2041049 RepID=A0AAE8MZL4_9PEZI|nr:probable kinesin-related protein KIP3 [Cephalotrichum gorgonifer]